MCARLVLALTLVSVTVAAGAGVSLWMNDITMTCPENGQWFQEKSGTSESVGKNGKTHEDKFKEGTNLFYCQYNTNVKTYFYLQGKECDNCVELDAWLFMVVICVDVTGTVLVMVLVYKCCRRSGGGAPKATAPARNTDIPLQDTTYQGLNHNTRSQDIYSRINNNRTG